MSDTYTLEVAKMSKGSARVTVRIGDDMLSLVDEYLRLRNLQSCVDPWNRTDFVMAAIAEKLSHAKRSRKERGRVRQFKSEENVPRTIKVD